MDSRTFRRIAAVLPTAMLLGCVSGGANYFGQNQVRYNRFDFKILTTEHFDIYYYDEEREAVQEAGRMAERWYARLSRLLNHELKDRQAIVFYASHPHFQETLVLGGAPGEGTGGATEVFKRRIVMPFAGPLKETDHVLGHEIVHAFQFDMTGQGGTVTMRNFPRALLLPLWFIEGMAEYLSVGRSDPNTAMWIRDASAHDRIPNMRQLRDPRFFPYRFGQAFWAYVAGRWGDDVVGRILNAAARTGSADAAFEQVLSVPVDTVNAEWRETVSQQFGNVRDQTKPPAEFAKVLLSREEGTRFNTAPVLSPDGSQLVFFAVKERFAIELFRADARTGEIYGTLIETAGDTHFESIQFIKSAGAWSPDGKRFAIAAVREADPVLAIVDVASGRRVAEHRFEELGEILNPSWSPDGRNVVFSALAGGFTDLFVFNLASATLRRMTHDKFADLQPAWAPDGSRIAFVTDRAATDLRRLSYGAYGLAMMDPVTGDIQPVEGIAAAKSINPQWSRDSRSLYYMADRNGITNVYRVDLANGTHHQITDLYTGVSGITALSPALSSATDMDMLAFSVYEEGGYNIYTIVDDATLAGRRIRR